MHGNISDVVFLLVEAAQHPEVFFFNNIGLVRNPKQYWYKEIRG